MQILFLSVETFMCTVYITIFLNMSIVNIVILVIRLYNYVVTNYTTTRRVVHGMDFTHSIFKSREIRSPTFLISLAFIQKIFIYFQYRIFSNAVASS